MVCLLLRARAGEDQEDGGELRQESVRQVMRRNTLHWTLSTACGRAYPNYHQSSLFNARCVRLVTSRIMRTTRPPPNRSVHFYAVI